MSPDPAQPPEAAQIAALPLRRDILGRLRVLMVTSRGTGRWVVPKGWPMDGRHPWQAAEIEALEEAGAVGFIGQVPLGDYRYMKELEDGRCIPVRVQIYPMVVERLKTRWKERRDRTRRWFSLNSAARRVDEPDLRSLLLSLATDPQRRAEIQRLLRKGARPGRAD